MAAVGLPVSQQSSAKTKDIGIQNSLMTTPGGLLQGEGLEVKIGMQGM
jgi:hypothetical protein